MARRRREDPAPEPLTLEQRERLLTGFQLSLPEPFEDEDDARRVWALHREELLADWTSNRPGTRPWAWWAFEATEPRKILAIKRQPSGDSRYQPPLRARKLSFGVPWPWYDWLQVESQAEYLRRLQLLTDAELEALDEADFEPAYEPEWARARRVER